MEKLPYCLRKIRPSFIGLFLWRFWRKYIRCVSVYVMKGTVNKLRVCVRWKMWAEKLKFHMAQRKLREISSTLLIIVSGFTEVLISRFVAMKNSVCNEKIFSTLFFRYAWIEWFINYWMRKISNVKSLFSAILLMKDLKFSYFYHNQNKNNIDS